MSSVEVLEDQSPEAPPAPASAEPRIEAFTAKHQRAFERAMRTETRPRTLEASFGQLQTHLNDLGLSGMPPDHLTYLRDISTEGLLERSSRAADAESSKVRAAAELANECHPYPFFSWTCVDERTDPAYMYMSVWGMRGGGIRTPAAASNRDFIRVKGKLVVKEGSTTAKLLDQLLEHYEVSVEALDSHLHCAKQKLDCMNLGLPVQDEGVFMDVALKKEMGKAIRAYAAARGRAGAIRILHHSYDPSNGNLIFGLGSEQALARGRQEWKRRAERDGLNVEDYSYGEFHPELIQALEKSGIIFSSRSLLLEEDIRVAFRQHKEAFLSDWVGDYRETALQSWIAVKNMKGKFVPGIINKIRQLPDFAQCEPRELEEYAVVLLANAFNTFCNTDTEGKFLHRDHDARQVMVATRVLGPHRLSSMGVFPGCDAAVNAEFSANKVVRGHNRISGKVSDPLHFPVNMVVEQVVRGVPQEAWAVVEQMHWPDPRESRWLHLSDADFLRRLTPSLNGNLDPRLVEGIILLRTQMRDLYMHPATSTQLIDGNLAAVPTLSDEKRRPHGIPRWSAQGIQ